jgi:hypothetical protein
MGGKELVEVETDRVEQVGGDPVSSLVAAGRGSLPSIGANQSFSGTMSVAASSQLRKSECELRGSSQGEIEEAMWNENK